MTLIGSRCKRSNALSRGVLINRLIFPHFCVEEKILLNLLIVFQHIEKDAIVLVVLAKGLHLTSIPNSEVKPFSADDTWVLYPGKVGHRQNNGVFLYLKIIFRLVFLVYFYS
jgi:hypothetical protein